MNVPLKHITKHLQEVALILANNNLKAKDKKYIELMISEIKSQLRFKKKGIK